MVIPQVLKLGLLLGADIHTMDAAGVKTAAGRWIDGAGNISSQDDSIGRGI